MFYALRTSLKQHVLEECKPLLENGQSLTVGTVV